MPRKTKPPADEPSIPATARAPYGAIVVLTDAFCRQHLDAEYEALCRRLAGVLARKRPSPLTRGRPEVWACAIVRVIGWVNFLDDSSQKPHLKLTAIDQAFSVSSTTGQAKAKAIRDLLKIRTFDPAWTLPSRMDRNPMAWLIEVNGLVLDARHLRREIQEEAFRKGLIPYLPGEGPQEVTDQGEEAEEDEGVQDLAGPAAADTACLVGELHLRKGEYEQAVAAFSRAIANNPTVDAYQGRAKAYRALAERDERKAQEQSGRG